MVAAIIIMITTDADDDDDIDSDDGKEEVRTKITKMLSMLLDRFLMGLVKKVDVLFIIYTLFMGFNYVLVSFFYFFC